MSETPPAEATDAPSPLDTKTVPGGGLNRISDGRLAAAAYLGVKSVPSTPPPPITQSAIKLSDSLMEENRTFRTEPALRASAPPPGRSTPPIPSSGRRSSSRAGSPRAVFAVVGFLALAVGMLAVLAGGVVAGDVAAVGSREPSAASPAAHEEVQWDHGIDGQPAVLAPPLASRKAPSESDESAAALPAPTTKAEPRPKAAPQPKPVSSSAAKSSAAKPAVESPSSEAADSQAAAQPVRKPPEPWLE